MKFYLCFFITFFCLPFISNAIEPKSIWANAWGGDVNDYGSVLSLDNAGNIFVAGGTQGTFKLGETTILNSNTRMSTSYLVKFSPGGKLLWVRGAATGNYNIVGIVNDNSGNTYIAGTFYSPTLSLGEFVLTNSTPVIYPAPMGAQYNKALVAKYSPTGDVIWAIAPTNEISSQIDVIVCDKAGSICISGTFRDNQMDFGDVSINNPNFNSNPQLSRGSSFLMKFDFYGKSLWGKSLGDNTIVKITLDKDDNFILGGTFKSSTINFNNISLQNPNVGSNSIFLTKILSNGLVIWAKSIGSNGGGSVCGSIATDFDGNICVAGNFTGTALNADGLSLINNNSKTTKSFLLKCNPVGKAQWIKSSENGDGNSFTSICTDNHSNVYALGNFEGDISFDNISLTNEMLKGRDMVVSKYKSDGTIVWAKNYGAAEDIHASSCLVDNKGDIHITGQFASKEIYFDKFNVKNYSYNTLEQLPFPSIDAFLIKLKQPSDAIYVMFCSTNNTAILSVDDLAKSYNWMNSSGQSIGDKPELTINNPVVGDTYSCHITYPNGAMQTLYTTIIDFKLTVDFNTITDCKTNNIQFLERVGSTHFPTQIKWDFGDGTISTQSNPSHVYSSAGKYKVSLEITNPLSACAEIFEKEIEVFDRIGFTVSNKQIDSRNNQIELNAEYNPKLLYTFDMGDGTIKHGANIVHTYQIDNSIPGYNIKLTTTNELTGCINEYTESIDVVPFIPNVFTPNADGVNDVFASNLDLLVVDRNGVKFYQGKDGWDGNYNGAKAPTDTYFYFVKYSDKHGVIQTKKGAVSLIR